MIIVKTVMTNLILIVTEIRLTQIGASAPVLSSNKNKASVTISYEERFDKKPHLNAKIIRTSNKTEATETSLRWKSCFQKYKSKLHVVKVDIYVILDNYRKSSGLIYNLNFLCSSWVSFRFFDSCTKSPPNKLFRF